jgi:hypothetical protein
MHVCDKKESIVFQCTVHYLKVRLDEVRFFSWPWQAIHPWGGCRGRYGSFEDGQKQTRLRIKKLYRNRPFTLHRFEGKFVVIVYHLANSCGRV